MLNFDMVGRLDSSDNKVGITGTGTSPSWSVLDSIHAGSLSIKKSETGTGPSDHTSFYRKDIPVLHFCSGTHGDYHNFGMSEIFTFVKMLISRLEHSGKIPFTKTKEEDAPTKRTLTVTLGIVPDYMFEGPGVKVDGVTDGKPGAVAGIRTGDIILSLGDFQAADMKAYMKALGNFAKGDKTEVKVKRGGETLTLPVQF
jgi:membrane-associated protease RseP (regulator of RpoE activity)